MSHRIRYIGQWVPAMVTGGILTLAAADVSRGATVTFYPTRAAFNAAAPGLPVETFAAANLFGQTEALEASPVSGATNDAVFPAGSILPGLTVSNLTTGNTPGLIVYAGGVGGSKSIGDNYFGDTTVLTFGPSVAAVAADVFANTGPGQSLAGSFTEQVYNGSTRLGSTTFTEAAGASAFVGVTSTTPITSVRLLYTTDDATTFVTNVAFGTVPEPASVGLVATFGLAALGRRRPRAGSNA